MLLEINNLSVHYGGVEALKDASLEVKEGEIVTLVGGNGAGKSTTLRTISGLKKPSRGSISFKGQRIENLAPQNIVRLGIGHVPEGRNPFPYLTVMENLQLATFARKDNENIKTDIKQVFSIFPRLEERKDQASGTLSGGEQQMLAVGRAYMSGRKIMLLDEPSMGLAPLLMLSMFDALKEINKSGTTILLVEQNVRLALKFAQRGYVIENGHLVLEGKSEELLNNPDVKKAYLGG